MQKIKAKILTTLLLAALTLTLVPVAFASTGNILINDTVEPQDLPIPGVPAGGNITLYFGAVTFSGSQFYLLLSQDGLSQVSGGDMRYTPLFNVAVVTGTTITQVPGTVDFPGGWTIGDGWVNGSIPVNIAGGTYYIKAFDGATTALAVTQGFTVIASLRIIPTSGAAGTEIIISANAFPANSLVNFSYVEPDLDIVRPAAWQLLQTNALGQYNITTPAPDEMVAPGPGLADPTPTGTFTFNAQQNGTGTTVYTATYVESQRGIVQIGRPRVSSSIPGTLQNATSTGVFGNMSSWSSTPTEGLTTISMGVGQSLRIAGKWFYPGVISAKWDNSGDDLVATSSSSWTAGATGTFNATFTVPETGVGTHNITLTDAGLQKFIVFVNVVPSITISPTSGPIGTTITVEGYGFPASVGSTVYNATITFSPSSTVRAHGLTTAAGRFTLSFNVPSGSAGGPHDVTATANQTGFTPVTLTFTVSAAFTVSPASFYANSSSSVVASGTGFDPANRYNVAIDNLFSPFSNTTNGIAPSSTGVITLTFIQAGFQPGLHVIALYLMNGTNAPAANATFTVLADPLTTDTGILTNINSTVTQIWNKTQIMNTEILAINDTVVTILTNVGVVQTTLDAINATVVAINGNVATLSTAIGNLQVSVDAINATVVAISGNVATVMTAVGTLQTSVDAINATLVSINGVIATINTNVGVIRTTVTNINGNITSITGTLATINGKADTISSAVSGLSGTLSSISSAVSGIATISTTVGSIQTSLSSIRAAVTALDGDIATIQTDLGTLQGTVTSISNGVATIQTDIGTLQADVSGLQEDVTGVPGQVNIPIWIAVVLALIAAIAAIASLLLVRRKIAG